MRSHNSGSAAQAPTAQPLGLCPQVSELSAFSRGALPLGALQSIAEHVSVCAACDSKVSTLVSELAHKRTEVHKTAANRAVSAGSANAPLDLGEAHIDASRAAPVEDADGPTAPLRLGQYRLVRQIGRGGMGVVYQALHEKLLRDVAIKFVSVETIQDLLDAQRLKREMAAAGTMRHPNVVFATDAGEAEGVHYLVMEYVEGVDLSKLVSRVGPLAVADACEIIRQAAEGLAHIEEQNLVHRDLKPSNLMLAADGTVKILDLGLARVNFDEADEHELTRNGYLLGTIDYIAPEQARDAHAADIRSDIYSLGCAFYKLLTGGPPFAAAGKSVAGKILAHEQQPPPPLSDHRADVPPEVEQILLRMLAKDPADRFQSPRELKRALKDAAAGADLPALLARAQIAPQPAVRRPAVADASRSTTLDTSPQKRSTINKLRVGPRHALAGVSAAVIVVVVLTGLWLTGWLPGISGFGKGREPRLPSPTIEDILASENSGQIDYPFPEGQPGIQGAVTPAGVGEITLDSEYIQLVRLGDLREDAKSLSFDVALANPVWQVGVFLGYHEDRATVKDNQNKEFSGGFAEFQLLILKPGPDSLVVDRVLGRVYPGERGIPVLYYGGVDQASRIPLPKAGKPLSVRIEFSGGRGTRQIKRVVICETELVNVADPPDLVTFTPRDYEGAVGLFNYGTIGGATFSNFDLSDLEKKE